MGRWRKDRTGGENFADTVSEVSRMIYTREIRRGEFSGPRARVCGRLPHTVRAYIIWQKRTRIFYRVHRTLVCRRKIRRKYTRGEQLKSLFLTRSRFSRAFISYTRPRAHIRVCAYCFVLDRRVYISINDGIYISHKTSLGPFCF